MRKKPALGDLASWSCLVVGLFLSASSPSLCGCVFGAIDIPHDPKLDPDSTLQPNSIVVDSVGDGEPLPADAHLGVVDTTAYKDCSSPLECMLVPAACCGGCLVDTINVAFQDEYKAELHQQCETQVCTGFPPGPGAACAPPEVECRNGRCELREERTDAQSWRLP